MLTVPRFFIVAGPNGAGKSTIGRAFVPADISIFNGDLVFAELCKQHPDVDPERLKGGVAVALERARDQALKHREDFSFETNFSTKLVIDLVNVFRKEGYKIHLLYFGLSDLNTSISRVRTRTALGGHDVPDDSIRFNFFEGIRLIKANLHAFDFITFISTPQRGYTIAHLNKAEKKLTLHGEMADWFELHFKTVLEQNLSQRMKTQKKRGRRM